MAASKATVLITGESGTGKEMFARYLHAMSKRARGPFVAVNCAALPEHLLESELFGHEKGAFTGAIARKLGKFELASGGTLLLDEISEMDLALQAKLLRVLQEGEIDRVGGAETVRVDVRVLATTNRDLEDWVKQGKFRQDLYFRLNVIPLRLPSLRERGDDVLELARFFVDLYVREYKLPPVPLSEAAVSWLKNYDFPGNVRELQNLMERAVLLANGRPVEPCHFLLENEAWPLFEEDSLPEERERWNRRNLRRLRVARGPGGYRSRTRSGIHHTGGAVCRAGNSAARNGADHDHQGPGSHLRQPHPGRRTVGHLGAHPAQQAQRIPFPGPSRGLTGRLPLLREAFHALKFTLSRLTAPVPNCATLKPHFTLNHKKSIHFSMPSKQNLLLRLWQPSVCPSPAKTSTDVWSIQAAA